MQYIWHVFYLLVFESLPQGLSSAGASKQLTDWDCRRVERRHGHSPVVPWDRYRRELQAAISRGEDLASVYWIAPYMEKLMLDEQLRAKARDECPLGLILLTIVQFAYCVHTYGPSIERCDGWGVLAMDYLFYSNISMHVWAASGWPITRALKMDFLHTDDSIPVQIVGRISLLNCEHSSWWSDFRTALNDQLYTGNWFWRALKWIFSDDMYELELKNVIDDDDDAPLVDCMMGLATSLLIKTYFCFNSETACYFTYSSRLAAYLRKISMWDLLFTNWPLVPLLNHFARTKTVLETDFFDEEIMEDLYLANPVVLQLKTVASHPFLETARAVLAGGAAVYTFAGEKRLISYASFVWGPQYISWIPSYIRRFQSLGVSNLIMFSADVEGHQLCKNTRGASCVFLPTQSILHRYSIPLALLNLGVDVFLLDFDIFPFKDPTAKLLQDLTQYGAATPDLLIAGSFGDACICNAMVFYRSTQPAKDFLRYVLGWLYDNPFPHGVTQKVLSAFLGDTPMQKAEPFPTAAEKPWIVRAEKLLDLPLPADVPAINWSILDPQNEFVSTSGWAGRREQIILFHFFHGGWMGDESIYDKLLNTSARPTQSTDYDDYQIFYNTTEDEIDPLGWPWANKAIVGRISATRVGDIRPATDLECSSLPLDYVGPGLAVISRPGSNDKTSEHLFWRPAMPKAESQNF